MSEIPLSLYIHIPWCIKKCPYCDFNSHEVRKDLPQKDYIDTLVFDFKNSIKKISNRELSSIFIGGGTPSLMDSENIQHLLDEIRNHIKFTTDIEITLEANPGTIDQKNFDGYCKAGVNRLSIGVQSFSDEHLQKLGRIHSATAAINAISKAKNAGFENINIDLMFGLPNQSLQQAYDDLQQAIQLHPTHISYYQLTIEPNTRFYQHPPPLPTDEINWEIQQQGYALLAMHGYQQYEVSAYAKPGFACIHNLNYWQFGDYLGIGAGAHQKLTCNGKIYRSEKPRHPQQYMKSILHKSLASTSNTLKKEDVVFEYLLNSLRLKQGFELQQFENHTGVSQSELEECLAPFRDKRWILQNHDKVYCSARGYQFLNEMLVELLPE